MKNKIKKLNSKLFDLLIMYSVVATIAIAVAFGLAVPLFGILSLATAIFIMVFKRLNSKRDLGGQ